MGLFSSIKKGISKAWKGVKKVAKKVARGVKKVAKKVAYSLPGGKQLWDLGSKVGKGIMKGIGKLTSGLGPIGTMALSFVLAPVMGPMVSSLWSGFGAGAAAMASSANAFVSTLGAVGQGVFAAGNFVSGTLGAMGQALTEGARNVMTGNFSQAATSLATNMSSAFTGEAGMAAVHAGNISASVSAATDLATQGGSALQVNSLTDSAADSLLSLQEMGQVGVDAIAGLDPEILAGASDNAFALQQNVKAQWEASQMSSPAFDTADSFLNQASNVPQAGPMSLNQAPNFGRSLEMTSQAMQQTGVTDMGVARNTLEQAYLGNTNFTSTTPSTSEVLQNTMNKAGEISSLLGGGTQGTGYQPYVPQAIKSQGISNAASAQGQGSAGFSLLGGVQGLEESLRRSQQLMFG